MVLFVFANGFRLSVCCREPTSGSSTEVKVLVGVQVQCDDERAPLLPPDYFLSPDLKDEFVPPNAGAARAKVKELLRMPLSARRRRKFAFGCLYKTIFEKRAYQVDGGTAVDLHVRLEGVNETSVVHIRRLGVEQETLVRSCGRLGDCLSGRQGGDCRGPKLGNSRKGVGDVGEMYAIGLKNAKEGWQYVTTRDNAAAKTIVAESSLLMAEYMRGNLKGVYDKIKKTERDNGCEGYVPELKDGPSSFMVVSADYGSAGHIDFRDESPTAALWVERKPGLAENWFFLLPNVSVDGSKGVLIQLRHGTVIAWEGRKIFHCSSIPTIQDGNGVYGCAWLSAAST
jgi:hypothetical protein